MRKTGIFLLVPMPHPGEKPHFPVRQSVEVLHPGFNHSLKIFEAKIKRERGQEGSKSLKLRSVLSLSGFIKE